jgi:hypothetical protein
MGGLDQLVVDALRVHLHLDRPTGLARPPITVS